MKSLFNTKVFKSFCCVYGLILFFFSSCLSADKPQSKPIDTPSATVVNQPTYTPSYPIAHESSDDDDTEEDNEDDAPTGITDGTYTASVDYSNPNTGYSATYTLRVDVSDGQVVQINFPNDGYLDEDHITPADVDDDGNANVEGEDGKTYDVHIDL